VTIGAGRSLKTGEEIVSHALGEIALVDASFPPIVVRAFRVGVFGSTERPRDPFIDEQLRPFSNLHRDKIGTTTVPGRLTKTPCVL